MPVGNADYVCPEQEYFKAVNTAKLDCPVYNVCFPGPAVHAKAAR